MTGKAPEGSHGLMAQDGLFRQLADEDSFHFGSSAVQKSGIDNSRPSCWVSMNKYVAEEKKISFPTGTKFVINRVVAVGRFDRVGALVSLLDDRELAYIVCLPGKANLAKKPTVQNLLDALPGRWRLVAGQKPRFHPTPALASPSRPEEKKNALEKLHQRMACARAVTEIIAETDRSQFEAASASLNANESIAVASHCRWQSKTEILHPKLKVIRTTDIQPLFWREPRTKVAYMDLLTPFGCFRTELPEQALSDKQKLIAQVGAYAVRMPELFDFYVIQQRSQKVFGVRNPDITGLCMVDLKPLAAKSSFMKRFSAINCDHDARVSTYLKEIEKEAVVAISKMGSTQNTGIAALACDGVSPSLTAALASHKPAEQSAFSPQATEHKSSTPTTGTPPSSKVPAPGVIKPDKKDQPSSRRGNGAY